MKSNMLSFLLLGTLSLPLAAMAPSMEPQQQPTESQPTFWQKHKRPLIYTGVATFIVGICLYEIYKENKKSENSSPDEKKLTPTEPQSFWAKAKEYTFKGLTYINVALKTLFDFSGKDEKRHDKTESNAQNTKTHENGNNNSPTKPIDNFVYQVNDDALCGICLETLFDQNDNHDTFLQTPCKNTFHIFHHDCLSNWLEEHNSCPECRRTIDEPCKPLICAGCQSNLSTPSNPFCVYNSCYNIGCDELGLVFHKKCLSPIGNKEHTACPSCNQERKMVLFATHND